MLSGLQREASESGLTDGDPETIRFDPSRPDRAFLPDCGQLGDLRPVTLTGGHPPPPSVAGCPTDRGEMAIAMTLFRQAARSVPIKRHGAPLMSACRRPLVIASQVAAPDGVAGQVSPNASARQT